MSKIRIANSHGGFTVIEMLVYVSLFGVVLSAIYYLFATNYKSYSSQENSMEMTQDLRAAIQIMTRDIRMAGLDPTGTANLGFLGDDENDPDDDRYNTDNNSAHFTMDVNGDGDTFDVNEDIQYYLSATDVLMRRANNTVGDESASPGKAESPLAENVTVLAFNYTFADGDTGSPDDDPGDDTDDHDDIRSVEIFTQIQTPRIDPILRKKKSRDLTTRVKVRNAGLEP